MSAHKDRRVLDLALVGLSLLCIGGVMLQFTERSNRNAELRMAESEALNLYDSLLRYEEQNGQLPGSGETAFDRASLDPLKSRGYYRGTIAGQLVDEQVDAYVVSPEVGTEGEFWMELTLRDQPDTRFLLARSDDAPLGGGVWREGVFLYRRGELKKVHR